MSRVATAIILIASFLFSMVLSEVFGSYLDAYGLRPSTLFYERVVIPVFGPRGPERFPINSKTLVRREAFEFRPANRKVLLTEIVPKVSFSGQKATTSFGGCWPTSTDDTSVSIAFAALEVHPTAESRPAILCMTGFALGDRALLNNDGTEGFSCPRLEQCVVNIFVFRNAAYALAFSGWCWPPEILPTATNGMFDLQCSSQMLRWSGDEYRAS